MKIRGPILTLAAGALVAATLLLLDLTTGPSSGVRTSAGSAPVGPTTASTATATGRPTAIPTVSATPAGPPTGTYAGEVNGGSGASIAIVVRDGRAVAYLCDGRNEAWLQGVADHGSVDLTGGGHARLTATFAKNRISGSVSAGAATYTFSVGSVAPPSGLYRTTAKVRQATVVGGWIVLPDGRQVGVVDIDGRPSTASALDTATLTTTVNGTTVTATAVDGSPLQIGQ
jgi:serine/threonine-protein kinase